LEGVEYAVVGIVRHNIKIKIKINYFIIYTPYKNKLI